MGTFWRTYRSTKRLTDHQFERLEERRTREAEFRRELADMDSAAQAAVLTSVYRKQLIRWIVAALLICPIILAAHWPSGLIIVGLLAWRIYRLIARRKAEEEKKRLIAEFVPMLNAFRLLLLQYPIDGFSEDMRAGLECRISGFYRLMCRFGAQTNGVSPAEVVALYQFRPEGFLAMKPKTVRRLFCTELPRLILTHADGIEALTPERFRTLIDDAREVLAAEYEAGLLAQGRIIFGHVVPIPEVCDLPAGMPVGLDPVDRHRFRHTYKLGKPDSGKSHDLANADLQDLNKGMGKVVISHGREYFEQRLLPRFPAHRVDDLIWFDPADLTPPIIGINPFRLEPGEDLHLKAGELYTVLERAMGDLAVTMRTILLNICSALLQTPGANITHLPLLLHPDDPAYRRRVLSVPTLDESTREFWERYDASRYYQASHEAVLNRLAPFFRPPLSITLSTPSFSCHRELNEHSRALFCNLSHLRGLAQELVGQFIIAQLRETFQARDHTQTPDQWRPTFVTIDEFHKYSSSEPALEDLLTGVRKFKVGLTMAHQTTASISSRLCSTILGTVGTVACFRISAEEAYHIARELQLVERRAHRQDEEIAAIEEAIGRERHRLRQLQAADSSVLHGLYADLQRARRARLMAGHDEPTVSLRADLLQNLRQGHQLIFGLPPFQQVVSLQAPAEPPGLLACFQNGPAQLIARSKEQYGIASARPITGHKLETPTDEDFWIVK